MVGEKHVGHEDAIVGESILHHKDARGRGPSDDSMRRQSSATERAAGDMLGAMPGESGALKLTPLSKAGSGSWGKAASGGLDHVPSGGMFRAGGMTTRPDRVAPSSNLLLKIASPRFFTAIALLSDRMLPLLQPR